MFDIGTYLVWWLCSLSFQFLITTILLSLTPFSSATRHRGDDESDITKQNRIFTQMNNWPFPISDEPQQDLPNPEVLFIDTLTLPQRFSSSIVHSNVVCVCVFFLSIIYLFVGQQDKFSVSATRSRTRSKIRIRSVWFRTGIGIKFTVWHSKCTWRWFDTYSTIKKSHVTNYISIALSIQTWNNSLKYGIRIRISSRSLWGSHLCTSVHHTSWLQNAQ